MTGQIKRVALVLLAAVGLGACGLFQGSLFQDSFWSSSPLRQNDEAELGIAELAKGNYVTAEGHFKKALKINPKDVHALLGSGILYQNTGQLTKAREMYEAVLAIRPDESQQFVVWSNISTRPAAQVASVNLSLLDSGGVTSAMASQAGQPPMGGVASMSQPAPPVSAAPGSAAMLGRAPMAPPAAAPQATQQAMAMPSPAAIGKFPGRDANVVSRFGTMRALRDQGLITEQEYQGRRRANLGALLPLTTPPPAAGLDRPVPSTEQISGRLRAIGRALEMRAISVSQHSAERSMILDALMPSAPVVVANPAPPPQGLLEAADDVRRLEQLKEGGFITSDEYAKERQAIEMAMQPPPPPKAAPVAMAPKPLSPAEAKKEEDVKKASSGPKPGVHLASYRSKQQADRGWEQIQKAHKAILEGLEHEVVKVNLGRKGTYYRLKAGPLDDQNAAKEMCRKLKARRQFCEPTVLEGEG
ncbi:MAG TPA: tetratricopeptide repeat protein [Rhodospirillales bacterium]